MCIEQTPPVVRRKGVLYCTRKEGGRRDRMLSRADGHAHRAPDTLPPSTRSSLGAAVANPSAGEHGAGVDNGVWAAVPAAAGLGLTGARLSAGACGLSIIASIMVFHDRLTYVRNALSVIALVSAEPLESVNDSFRKNPESTPYTVQIDVPEYQHTIQASCQGC